MARDAEWGRQGAVEGADVANRQAGRIARDADTYSG